MKELYKTESRSLNYWKHKKLNKSIIFQINIIKVFEMKSLSIADFCQFCSKDTKKAFEGEEKFEILRINF